VFADVQEQMEEKEEMVADVDVQERMKMEEVFAIVDVQELIEMEEEVLVVELEEVVEEFDLDDQKIEEEQMEYLG